MSRPSAGQHGRVSDDELRGLVLRRIQDFLPEQHNSLRVSVRSGVVTLQGQVASDYEQFTLVQLVRRISWVRDVVDEIVPQSKWAAHSLALELSLPSAGRQKRWPVVISLLILFFAVAGWKWVSAAQAPKLTVTVFGKPATGLMLTLHSLNRQAAMLPQGEVQSNGLVRWNRPALTGGIDPGDYVVTARWNPSISRRGDSPFGPWDLPAETRHAETSHFRLHVPQAGSGPLSLELSPASSLPPHHPTLQERLP